jgi:lysophospholipase L1-like esterase
MSADKKVVACLGSSTTAATWSYNWIRELHSRPQNSALRFVNLGVNGDLSWNALQRVGDVIACKPNEIIVLIGANDVMALVAGERMKRIYKWRKKLPRPASPEWFRENLSAIARRLKSETRARIGLASMQPLGEAPDSANEFQNTINQRTVEFNRYIREIAAAEGAIYIPIWERLHAAMVASPGRALEAVSFGAFYRSKIQQFFLRRSFDELAVRGNWKFHVDGVHLNTRGGKILAEVVQEFLACSSGLQT